MGVPKRERILKLREPPVWREVQGSEMSEVPTARQGGDCGGWSETRTEMAGRTWGARAQHLWGKLR